MLIRSQWVAPVACHVIRDGYVDIAGDQIRAVGAWPPEPGATPDITFDDCVLTPGLVNAHAHLELTCYADQLEPAPLWDWIARLIEIRSAPGQIEREQQAVRDGAQRSLAAGVTCVGDISRRNLGWSVLRDMPLRKVAFVELLSTAAQPPRTLDELRDAVAAVEEDDLLTVGLSPHAPYSVASETFAAVVRLAGELQRPWCTHWAETRDECAFLAGNIAALPPMLRPLLERAGVRSPEMPAIDTLLNIAPAPPGLVAHMNYADDVDALVRLAEADHTIIYCPRAHRFFDHAPHPWPMQRAAGVRIAIGTDSAASGATLSLLDELKLVHELYPDVAAADLLEMATIHPAVGLGLADQIGTLAAGKQADLAAFPVNGADPLEDLVNRTPQPKAVWVAGRRVI